MRLFGAIFNVVIYRKQSPKSKWAKHNIIAPLSHEKRPKKMIHLVRKWFQNLRKQIFYNIAIHIVLSSQNIKEIVVVTIRIGTWG